MVSKVCQTVLLVISVITGSCGQLCQFDDGFCGWIASGHLAWDINYVSDSGNKGYVAAVRIPEADQISANTGLTKLISPTHHGAPTIKNSMLSFSYLIKGQNSLSVEAELDLGKDVVELWSSNRSPRELDNRWKKAEVSVPESEAFAVSFLADVQPGPDAFLGITNVSLVVGDTNECADKPCQNNGICVDGDGHYTCLCVDGYRGTQCQIPPRTQSTKVRLTNLKAVTNTQTIAETTIEETTVDTSNITTIDTTPDTTTSEDLVGTTWFETMAFTEIVTSTFTPPETQTTPHEGTTMVATTILNEPFETTPVTATEALNETQSTLATTATPVVTTEPELTQETTPDAYTSPEVTEEEGFTTDEVTEEYMTPTPSTKSMTTSVHTTSHVVEPGTTENPTTVRLPITEGTTSGTYPTEKPQQQLTPGEIAGIVIGSLLFFLLCFFFIIYVILYKRRHKAYRLDYFDEEFIMEYVNRKPQQKYTGYWKASGSHVQDKNSNGQNVGDNENSKRNNDHTPYQLNSAMNLEEDSAQEETYSEGDHETTREDETAFQNYDINYTGEESIGRNERFI